MLQILDMYFESDISLLRCVMLEFSKIGLSLNVNVISIYIDLYRFSSPVVFNIFASRGATYGQLCREMRINDIC